MLLTYPPAHARTLEVEAEVDEVVTVEEEAAEEEVDVEGVV